MTRFVAAIAAAAVIALGAGSAHAAAAPGVPVLMYHRIDRVVPADAVGRSLTIEPGVFEAQLAWLSAHHIRTLTTAELVAALAHGEHPRDAVVLTFDDGYTDAATEALPLLRKYHAVASFYVSAGFIGDGRHADWRQLRAMRGAGMEIGCHGTFHLDLASLDRAGARGEIAHCVTTLARYLVRPTTYAYAAGKWNAETIAVLRESGIAAALTERAGVVTSLAEPYALPRRRVDRDDDLAAFAALARP